MSKLIFLGTMFLFLGIIIIFAGSLFASQKEDSNIKTAGGIFRGPFPLFGFASDKKMFYILLMF